MSDLCLPSGQEIQLFASDPFITGAMARGIGRMTIDAGETDQVIRKARAGETIPLGAIALVSPVEARSYATTELIMHGTTPPSDTRPAQTLRLRPMNNGFPFGEHVSWEELLQEQQARRNITFRLGTDPEERIIARQLYNVAAIAPGEPENDKDIGSLFGLASGLLGMINPSLRPAADLVGRMGKNLSNARQSYDLGTIEHHRPIVLEKR